MTPADSAQLLLILKLALALSLYAFFILVLLVIWRDLKQQSLLLISQEAPTLTLLHQNGTEKKSQQFTKREILVGRDPACDWILNDSTVSAQHARLSYHHNQWWVEDLNSRNGTFLNEELVSTPLVVTSGDEIRFGQIMVTVLVDARG
jgi:pSer/pThr/pTyr-binding forkhead associated (FHA) protein